LGIRSIRFRTLVSQVLDRQNVINLRIRYTYSAKRLDDRWHRRKAMEALLSFGPGRRLSNGRLIPSLFELGHF
jgi:hypothetical protein